MVSDLHLESIRFPLLGVVVVISLTTFAAASSPSALSFIDVANDSSAVDLSRKSVTFLRFVLSLEASNIFFGLPPLVYSEHPETE